MSSSTENLKRLISDSLDRRRLVLQKTMRVLLSQQGTVLFDVTAAMAIPMIYAQWEGFVKEAGQLYLEHIDAQALSRNSVQPAIVVHSMRRSFQVLTGGASLAAKTEIVATLLGRPGEALRFEPIDLTVDTKSNLHFKQLEGLCQQLCLDVSTLVQHKQRINSLVHRRNNIAHGGFEGSPKLQDIEDLVSHVIVAMEDVESLFHSAVDSRSYVA